MTRGHKGLLIFSHMSQSRCNVLDSLHSEEFTSSVLILNQANACLSTSEHAVDATLIGHLVASVFFHWDRLSRHSDKHAHLDPKTGSR